LKHFKEHTIEDFFKLKLFDEFNRLIAEAKTIESSSQTPNRE
jgi:hypothetical protein